MPHLIQLQKPGLLFLKWEQAEKVEISYYILFSLLDEAFGVRQSFLECLQDSKVVLNLPFLSVILGSGYLGLC